MINTTRQIERGYILKENITSKDISVICSMYNLFEKCFNITMVINGDLYNGNDLFFVNSNRDAEGKRVDNDDYIIRLKDYARLNDFNLVFSHDDVDLIGFTYPIDGDKESNHVVYLTLKKDIEEYKVKFK